MIVAVKTIDDICSYCIVGKKLTSYQNQNTQLWSSKDSQTFVSKHCGHVFHKVCVKKILEKHKFCPICRDLRWGDEAILFLQPQKTGAFVKQLLFFSSLCILGTTGYLAYKSFTINSL